MNIIKFMYLLYPTNLAFMFGNLAIFFEKDFTFFLGKHYHHYLFF